MQATEGGTQKEREKQGVGGGKREKTEERRDKEAESERDRKGPWPLRSDLRRGAFSGGHPAVKPCGPTLVCTPCIVPFHADSGLACVARGLWQRKPRG